MNKINSSSIVRTISAAATAVGIFSAAHGGVPLNNLQGAGGIALNPLAYTAGRPWDGADGGGSTNDVEHSALNGIVSRPQFGAWYVNLNDADINWGAFGAAFTVADRLELSAGYELVNARKYGDRSINKYNLGAKLRILDENAFDTAFVPAVAVGGIYKYTDSRTVDALGLDNDGFDAYVVASKLITQTPIPVLVSAGLLYTDEVVNGVVGHNDYDLVAFANLDVLPAENIAVGVEYKQGARVGDGIRNHDYWNGHIAWFVNPNLTLVAAYVETGDKDRFYQHGSAKNLGVGSGLVFSVQYQF